MPQISLKLSIRNAFLEHVDELEAAQSGKERQDKRAISFECIKEGIAVIDDLVERELPLIKRRSLMESQFRNEPNAKIEYLASQDLGARYHAMPSSMDFHSRKDLCIEAVLAFCEKKGIISIADGKISIK